MALATFVHARNGNMMAKINGVACFPNRRGVQPAAGETWELESLGRNSIALIQKVHQPATAEHSPIIGKTIITHPVGDLIVASARGTFVVNGDENTGIMFQYWFEGDANYRGDVLVQITGRKKCRLLGPIYQGSPDVASVVGAKLPTYRLSDTGTYVSLEADWKKIDQENMRVAQEAVVAFKASLGVGETSHKEAKFRVTIKIAAVGRNTQVIAWIDPAYYAEAVPQDAIDNALPALLGKLGGRLSEGYHLSVKVQVEPYTLRESGWFDPGGLDPNEEND